MNVNTTPNTEPGLQLPHDIIAPDPISAWPFAYGWWLVLVLLVLMLAATTYWIWRRHRARHPLRDALAQLNGLNSHADDRAFVSACAHWLKQKAIYFYGREQTAALHGEEWLRFLDNTGNTTAFSSGAGQALIALYQPAVHVQREVLLDAMTQWLQTQMQLRTKHHV